MNLGTSWAPGHVLTAQEKAWEAVIYSGGEFAGLPQASASDLYATFTGGYGPSPVIGDYPEKFPWGWILAGAVAFAVLKD